LTTLQPDRSEANKQYKELLTVIYSDMVALEQHMKYVDLHALSKVPNYSSLYKDFYKLRDDLLVVESQISNIISRYPFDD